MQLSEALKYVITKPSPPDPTKVKRAAEVGYDLPPFGPQQQQPPKPPFTTTDSDMPPLSLMGEGLTANDGARIVSPDKFPEGATPSPPQPPQKPLRQIPTKPGGKVVLKRGSDDPPKAAQVPPSLAKVSGPGWELVEDTPDPKPKTASQKGMGKRPSFTLLTTKAKAGFIKALEEYKKSQSSTGSAPTEVKWEKGLQPPTQ